MSNYSKNTDLISKIASQQSLDVFYSSGAELIKISDLDIEKSLTGTYVKNINFTDKIYFSKQESFDVEYNTGVYNINIGSGYFVFDLNDLSSDYRIKALGFEIEPKSGGIFFIDNTDSSSVFVYSINSVYKFTFKSKKGRKLNYYYNYPHNYILFNIENNTFSRIGGDVFRIKTIVRDGFLKNKLKDDISLGGFLKNDKLTFFEKTYDLIKQENRKYKNIFNKIQKLDNFNLIGEKYIEKYTKYFINNAKKRVYYKQILLKRIQRLFLEEKNSTDTSDDIITKLEDLKSYNIDDYNDILLVIDGYYRTIVKNNNLDIKVKLNNFLPLISYIELVKNNEISNKADLLKLVEKNQNIIFNLESKEDKSRLIKNNIGYFYLLRNISKKDFNKLILSLELKYKQFKNLKGVSKNNSIFIDKYYFGVLNLKQGNNDLELYILLKNIYFSYDFLDDNLDFEKYFNNFVDIYFSKLKIVNDKIVIGQHLDLVLLESFLYYLEDYLNNFAFVAYDKDSGNVKRLNRNIDILEKYMLLNKVIYFNDTSSEEVINTGIFKNRDLLKKSLNFIRENLFNKSRDDNGLLLTSANFNLDITYIRKFSNVLKKIFIFKDKYSIEGTKNTKQKILLENYNFLEKQYKEYFLALSSYEDYKTKYDTKQQELNDYYIKTEEERLGIESIKNYLKQFYGASFDNISISETKNEGEFLVKNYTIYGGTMSFLIEPERGYTIYDIILESDIERKNMFFDKTYKLEMEEEIWKEKKKYVASKDKENFDFKYYFKNKFFTEYISNIITDDDKQKILEDNENIRIFKRDKLLGKNGEFSKIRELLDISYNNIEAKSLKDIVIKDAKVIKRLKNINYIFDFNSNYYIDKEKNKHYFYKQNGIELKLFTKTSNKNKRYLLGENPIYLKFNVNLSDFNEIFENIFSQIPNLNKIYYFLSGQMGVYKVNFEYEKNGKIIIGFDFERKNVKIYLSGDKISLIKINGKVSGKRNVIINKGLEDLLLKLKQ